MQLEAVSSRPIASFLGEETNTCLTTTSFQVAVEGNKVSPQPSLQIKQSQLHLLKACEKALKEARSRGIRREVLEWVNR